MTPEETAQRADSYVARAIHLFDTWGEHPHDDRAITRAYEIPVNWRDAIPYPLTEGDMGSDDACVLARVMVLAGADYADDPYVTGLELLDMTGPDAAQHGFDLSITDAVTGDLRYRDLAAAWNRALGHV